MLVSALVVEEVCTNSSQSNVLCSRSLRCPSRPMQIRVSGSSCRCFTEKRDDGWSRRQPEQCNGETAALYFWLEWSLFSAQDLQKGPDVLFERNISLAVGLRDVAEIKGRVLASPSRQDEFFGLSDTPETPLIGGDATYKVIRDRVAVIFNCQRLTALVCIIMKAGSKSRPPEGAIRNEKEEHGDIVSFQAGKITPDPRPPTS
ncbi:hypothetical protein BDP67DRAFT_496617 [Colletotrichum lupini]|nr:hypothetical protein BDP67DRAFT_496617 [Colletotrichum lupini]